MVSPVKVTQSVVIGGGSVLGGLGGPGGGLVVVVAAAAVVLAAAGVFEALVHLLLVLLLALVGMVAAGVAGRWALLRHRHAPRPLGAAGVVVSRDPVLVDGRVCVRCVQDTPRVERAAVVVALHPGGAVAALCAAHLAAARLAAAQAAAHLATTARAVAGQERRWSR